MGLYTLIGQVINEQGLHYVVRDTSGRTSLLSKSETVLTVKLYGATNATYIKVFNTIRGKGCNLSDLPIMNDINHLSSAKVTNLEFFASNGTYHVRMRYLFKSDKDIKFIYDKIAGSKYSNLTKIAIHGKDCIDVDANIFIHCEIMKNLKTVDMSEVTFKFKMSNDRARKALDMINVNLSQRLKNCDIILIYKGKYIHTPQKRKVVGNLVLNEYKFELGGVLLNYKDSDGSIIAVTKDELFTGGGTSERFKTDLIKGICEEEIKYFISVLKNGRFTEPVKQLEKY